MLTGKLNPEERWAKRIARAQELRDQCQPAAEILHFYKKLLVFQSAVATQSHLVPTPNARLQEQVDPSRAALHMTPLLSLARTEGTEVLRREAMRLQQAGKEARTQLLRSALSGSGAQMEVADWFFALACLQPMMENLQLQLPATEEPSRRHCPACGSLPLLAVLRDRARGASRWLQCSFCLREWLFRRLVCPWCGEESSDQLLRYSADEYPQARVEACDTCKHYLKAIDLTGDGRAVPLVDEVATGALDLWAADRAYRKIARNIVGL
jgi:FdhE protein